MRKHRFERTDLRRALSLKLRVLSLGLLLAVPIVGFSQKLHKFDNLTEAVSYTHLTLPTKA